MRELSGRISDPILSKRELADWLGVSVDGVERRIKAGDGPVAVQLSPRRIGFRLSAVERWLASREIVRQPEVA